MGSYDSRQGTLAVIVLATLDVLAVVYDHRIARRMERISDGQLALNQARLRSVHVCFDQTPAGQPSRGRS